MTKKKWLKQDLEHAERMLSDAREANAKFAEELSTLRAEKRNREIAQKIADAIGTGTVYATNISITQRYNDLATLEISLSGDITSLYNLGNVFKGGI